VPTFFHSATRDSVTGTIYLKVVNPMDTPQPIHVKVSGVRSIEPSGQIVELKGAKLADLNTITEPTKVVPTTAKADGLGADFTRTFPPYSASVLVLNGK
jgi:alpha-N-arabinofuranosidase